MVLFTASGTGAMEAAVANLTSAGDKVLVVSAGKFGERWEGLAKAYGCEVEVVRAPYGETVTPQQVKDKLKPEHRVLYMQATESSTGARHDVEGIARALRGSDTLLVVDAITGLGRDDSARPGLLRGERARLAAHGDRQEPALLF